MENPYASALALCRVSKLFRRAALPKILHTISLSAPHSVTAFLHALQMQKAYAQKNHHLHFEYAPHVHRVWIRYGPHSPAPVRHRLTRHALSEPEMDFGLLAPVLLAAESLALNFESVFLLMGCLHYAWNSDMATTIDHARSPLRWNTKTLTIASDAMHLFLLRIRPEGSAFLASISHVIALSDPTDSNLHISGRHAGELRSGDYKLPRWMTRASWASFTSLQTVSLALPHIILPINFRYVVGGMNLQVELLTFSASLMMDDEVPLEIKASTETGHGRISLDDVRVTLSRGCVHFCASYHDWEKAWAGRLLG
ncbi:hypothetical protein DFH29DRAFT_831809 [Suillus ampliporus]|nr:hypothetical protein DFH29DRAFT_831809 [Suillus ampliporus]